MGVFSPLSVFLHSEIGQISPRFGAVSLLNCTENLEKKEKSTGENSKKNPLETAQRNCRFLSLVMVERVLKNNKVFWGFPKLSGTESRSARFPESRAWKRQKLCSEKQIIKLNRSKVESRKIDSESLSESHLVNA